MARWPSPREFDTPTGMGKTFVAAAVQMTATADLQANLATCRKLVAEAAAGGAELVLLPECFPYIGKKLADRLEVAEALDASPPGPIEGGLIEMAREHRIWLIGGGFPVVGGDPERAFNTCALYSPSGERVAAYHKIHLFDIDIPGRATFRESAATIPGTEPVVAATDLGRIGLSICYDLRFPELYRRMALSMGAAVLVVPAAFTAHTGAAHWHTLLRARAIENQCFVIAAAQTGHHHETRESYGHSLIYDPWGDLLAEQKSGEGLAMATLDLGRIDEVRSQMPCHSHVILK